MDVQLTAAVLTAAVAAVGMGVTLLMDVTVLTTGVTVLTGATVLTGEMTVLTGETVFTGVTTLTTGTTELTGVTQLTGVTGATAAMARHSSVVELQSPRVKTLVSFCKLVANSGAGSGMGERLRRGEAWGGECRGGVLETGESAAASGVGGVRLTSGVDELTTAGPVGDSRGGGCADGDGTVDVT